MKKKLDFVNVTEEIVYKIINNLKPKDSCGQDGLVSSLLIQLKHILTKPLTIIINQSLKSRILPDKLKIAKVIPLYKKGRPICRLLGNYRPISLLPAISKLFKRVLSNQIYDFSIKIDSMDSNEIPINVYLDLSEAFETLDHNILLHKLRHDGIRGTCLALLRLSI